MQIVVFNKEETVLLKKRSARSPEKALEIAVKLANENPNTNVYCETGTAAKTWLYVKVIGPLTIDRRKLRATPKQP